MVIRYLPGDSLSVYPLEKKLIAIKDSLQSEGDLLEVFWDCIMHARRSLNLSVDAQATPSTSQAILLLEECLDACLAIKSEINSDAKTIKRITILTIAFREYQEVSTLPSASLQHIAKFADLLSAAYDKSVRIVHGYVGFELPVGPIPHEFEHIKNLLLADLYRLLRHQLQTHPDFTRIRNIRRFLEINETTPAAEIIKLLDGKVQEFLGGNPFGYMYGDFTPFLIRFQ